MEDQQQKQNLQQQQQQQQCQILARHYKKYNKYSPNRLQNLFFLNGITSLLGWNAILASFDYFNNVYSDYDPILYFPVPLFIGYVVVSLTFNMLSHRFGYKKLITWGIFGTNAMLAAILVFSIVFKDMQDVGFGLSLTACFFIGIFGNFAQLSFFAMINYFGESTVSRYTIGTAGSGLSLVILQIIIAAFFKTSTNITGIIIYISLAILFNFYDLFLNIKLIRSEVYHVKIHEVISQEKSQQLLKEYSEQNQLSKSYFQWLRETLFAINPYAFFIMANFVITFLLFPNIGFAVKTGLVLDWSILVLNLMYQIGDLCGKILGDFRHTFNGHSITYLLISRLFFFYTMILLVKAFAIDDILLNNNFFPFFNMFLFALTNGLVTNGSFILAFEKCPNQYKKYAGVLGGIFLQLGIMIGSFLAIGFVQLVDPDVQQEI